MIQGQGLVVLYRQDRSKHQVRVPTIAPPCPMRDVIYVIEQKARIKEEKNAARRAQKEAKRLAKEAKDKKLQAVRHGSKGE